MLITALASSLTKFRMRIELSAADNGRVTLTIIPTPINTEVGKDAPATLTRPISLTGTPEELDAELAKGEAGALSSIFATRRTLAQQIEDQKATEQAELEASRKKAAEKAAASKSKQPVQPTKADRKATPSALDIEVEEDEPSPATREVPVPEAEEVELSLY
jgi:PRTRC genetic system protein E